MPFATLNDFKCHYQYDDFGQNETIVFVNSLGTNLSMWEAQADVLSHHCNILRYDMRGHGQSEVGDKPTLDIATLGSDVLALLDELQCTKVHFCGLSIGGLVGQWLGINAPDRFNRIIISNTAAKIGNLEGWNSRIEQVQANGLESIVAGTGERWFTPTFREQQPEAVNQILANFVKTTLPGYLACCAAVRDADFRTQLHELNVPTLVISGAKDPVTTVDDAEFLTKHIPVSSHAMLDAAHLSNVGQSEKFSKYILNFLQHHS
ncbi:MAG: 3-oxoadipate enol-lactonase [Rudanella sp.]|nr:3-oxoadipate enol-lactonase [Rudanella sp.]